MRVSKNWRRAHRRHSVRALIVGSVVSAVGAAWAAMPGAIVDLLPMWVVLLVPGAIFALGLAGTYIEQHGVDD
jgi:amino acid transporter